MRGGLKHIGILAHSADGAALCFLEVVREGARLRVPTPVNEAIVREVHRHRVGTLKPDPRYLEPLVALLPA